MTLIGVVPARGDYVLVGSAARAGRERAAWMRVVRVRGGAPGWVWLSGVWLELAGCQGGMETVSAWVGGLAVRRAVAAPGLVRPGVTGGPLDPGNG